MAHQRIDVLVVTHDPATARLLVDALGHLGHHVATSTTTAVGHVDAAAVVLDVRVDPGGGWRLLRDVRGRGGTPVVTLVPRDHERVCVRSILEGADTCLVEPFRVPDVAAALARLLGTGVGERTRARATSVRGALRRLAELDSGRVADGGVRLHALEPAPRHAG